MMSILLTFFLDDVKDLFKVLYSEDGSSERPLQEQAWIHFCDFLDECEGKHESHSYTQ